MSFSSERRKSRKSTPEYLQVWQTLRSTKYSRIPFSVVTPVKTLRKSANDFIACSALLLFQGTPSWSRNVNNESRFFSNRALHLHARSLLRSTSRSFRKKRLTSDLCLWRNRALRP